VVVLAGCAPYIEAGGPAVGPTPSMGLPGVYHRVERGQTVWRIAQVYGVELGTLVAANRLADAGRIEVGQRLFIPGARDVLPVPVLAQRPGDGPAGGTVLGEDFIWPVHGRVRTFFGIRTHHGPNRGIDIQTPEGTQVRAARSGRVAFLDQHLRGFGKTVILDHGGALSTVYTHLASIAVTAGQPVHQGQVIGVVGSTGRATVPSLHFEVRRHHRPENPFYYLP